MTEQLKLCGHTEDEWRNFEPCPLEEGHEGSHVYWYQVKMGVTQHNINVVTDQGEPLLHAQFAERAEAEDVCALLAIMEIVAENRDR